MTVSPPGFAAKSNSLHPSTKSSLDGVPEGQELSSRADEDLPVLHEFQQSVVPHQREMSLMIRNVPNRYTQRMFLAEIRKHGFERTFDFIYMPMDFRTKNNM